MSPEARKKWDELQRLEVDLGPTHFRTLVGGTHTQPGPDTHSFRDKREKSIVAPSHAVPRPPLPLRKP